MRSMQCEKCSYFFRLVLVASLLLFRPVWSQIEPQYRFEELARCNASSLELMGSIGPNDAVEPCILYEIKPTIGDDEANNTFVIPLVQVTPAECGNHRDGASMAVQQLNRGFKIGFYEDHTVKFSLVSVVAGNPVSIGTELYERRHDQLLRSLLGATGAPYIVGTCSFASEIEKRPANDYQAIILTQVGPPSFYHRENSNPYVFGFHINSDTYTFPNVQELIFNAPRDIPIRVIYRNRSEFFFSTCQSAIERLLDAGFSEVKTMLYDPTRDEDRDGIINQFDEDFLKGIADEACAPRTQTTMESFHPAMFMCTLTEQDMILDRWLETGCRPQSIWLTASTWNWALENSRMRSFFQGGGQWHEGFDYSDEYFASGMELLKHNQMIFGYEGTYDQVVSYAIPMLFSQHLKSAYRVTDVPNPEADFADQQGRERLRRAMLVLNADTIFGPVAFDNNQRNAGREPAGTQWLLNRVSGETFNRLVSPLLQAEASMVSPADSAIPCARGDYVNINNWITGGSVLASPCGACPVDTFTPSSNHDIKCTRCPEESSTEGRTGSHQCVVYEESMLGKGILALGYSATGITWIMAIYFLLWMIRHHDDPVVKMSQREFLTLICFGAMISSSTVISLSLQGGMDDDLSAANAGCVAAPFLYAIGWAMQYSSLGAKTYRLYHTMLCSRRMQRVQRGSLSVLKLLPIVIVCLGVDLIIVLVWTIESPLSYVRTEQGRVVDEVNHLVRIKTVGRCMSSDGSFWQYVGPLVGFHAVLLVATNVLLCQVRDIADRYQEQKYIAMASALMLEVLLIGIPVLVSVNDNADATFIVFTAVIALDDIAVLSCIFFPKIRFQAKGLEEGVQVGESVMRASHRRAALRETTRLKSGVSMLHSASDGTPPQAESSVPTTAANGDDKKMDPSEEFNLALGMAAAYSNGSFLNRFVGNDRRSLSSAASHVSTSLIESIPEETSEEVQEEVQEDQESYDLTPIATTRKTHMLDPLPSESFSVDEEQDPSACQGSNGFGSVDRGALGNTASSSSTATAATSNTREAKENTEQSQMRELLRKLMRDHESMLQTMNELMNENELIRKESLLLRQQQEDDETPPNEVS